ncbi:hypothetical protein ACWIBQ_10655 [Microbacterium keratanolyticum]
MTDPQQPVPKTPPVPPAPPIELTFDPPAAPPAAPAPAASAPDAVTAPAPNWSAAPPPPANFPGAPAVPGSAAPLAPALPTSAQPAAPGYGARGYAVPGYGAPVAPQSGAAHSASYPSSTGYAPPTGAYAAPIGGYTQGYPAPAAAEGPQTRTLGTVALIIALIAAVGTSFVGAYAALEIGRNALTPETLMSANTANVLSFLSPVREYVLWLEISFWAGTVLGIWALVQGIVATAKRRGRGMGIGAIILSVLGPVIYSMIVWIGFFAGAAIAGS